MSVVVRKVENKADFKAFFEFPWRIYQDNPYWVPDMPSLRRTTLDKQKHAAWEYMDGDYFVAWRGQEPVGTIAAMVNHRHNQFHDENIGFFGFFECVDDQAVADALFGAAEDYLRAKGVTDIRGPASFTSNEPYGLLIDSFDKQPMVLMPYNHAYYMRLIENAGFQKVKDLYSWIEDLNIEPALVEPNGEPTRAVRAVRRNMERRKITIRTINMKDKGREFQTLRDLYDAGWEKNWGFVPMTNRELDGLVKDLGLLLLPDYTFFGEVDGQPVGFLLAIPNFNQVLGLVRPRPGVPEIWYWLKALWHWKMRPKIKSLRFILMGVREDYRGLGVDAAMHLAIGEQLLKDPRFTQVEASWVLEDNDNLNRLAEHFGATMHRTHRLYQKAL